MVTNRLAHFPFSARFLIVLLGSLFAACHSPIKTDNQTTTPAPQTTMEVYSASIHAVSLPFTDTCYDTLATQTIPLPDSLAKFKAYGKLVGKVNETKQYTALLYSIPADVQLPILHTFNARGEKIASLKLFIGDCCGENEGCSGLSTVIITKNMHIILKDSMQTFERDKKKFDKKKNIQIIKKYREYRIDSTGRIIQLGLDSSREQTIEPTLS